MRSPLTLEGAYSQHRSLLDQPCCPQHQHLGTCRPVAIGTCRATGPHDYGSLPVALSIPTSAAAGLLCTSLLAICAQLTKIVPRCHLHSGMHRPAGYTKLTKLVACCIVAHIWVHLNAGLLHRQAAGHGCSAHQTRSSVPSPLNRPMPAGLLRTGLLGIFIQLTCLVVAVSPALLSLVGTRIASAAATHILVGGLVASRFGLWTFDLCMTQLLQEWVLTQELGESRV